MVTNGGKRPSAAGRFGVNSIAWKGELLLVSVNVGLMSMTCQSTLATNSAHSCGAHA